MDDQRLRVTDVGQQAEQLRSVDEPLARFETALNAERHQRAAARGEILLRPLVVLAGGQTGIVYPLHIRMAGEILGNLERVLDRKRRRVGEEGRSRGAPYH